MPEKNEPLKGKTFFLRKLCASCDSLFRGDYVFEFEDVKSAIQGLLEELEEKRTELENKKLEYAKKLDDEGMAIIEVLLSSCDWFEQKIKKWFPDVVNKDEN